MKILRYIPSLLLFATIISCDESEEPAASNDPNKKEPVTVVVDNSGFSHVFDDVRFLSSASAFQPYMDVLDYTLEANNKLHIAYFASQPTQQDALVENERVTINIDTKEEIALPSAADTLNYSPSAFGQQKKSLIIQQYRPYTNFFTYATSSSATGMLVVEYKGDVSGKIGPTPNPIGIPDFGYRFPVTNVSVGVADNAFAWFLTGVPNPTYTLSNTNGQAFNFFNNSGKVIMCSFSESDIFTYGKFRSIFVRPDSVIAFEVNDERTARTKKSALAVAGLSSGINLETLRHYSSDGKILGMLIKDVGQKKYWTFSYNFATQTLTKGHNGVTLDFSGEGSDFDIDEFGNVYYTGFAANGSNTSGVSIYKKAIDGNVSVVGKDSFLKFGTVVKLKTLNGKVYVAVTGKQSNSSLYQLSILKQD